MSERWMHNQTDTPENFGPYEGYFWKQTRISHSLGLK